MILTKKLHHLISIVNNIEQTVEFYINVLGRRAVRFVTENTIEEVLNHFGFHKVSVEEVPVTIMGSLGALTYIY
ncbi:VOC family protein [Bacillus sp. JZ8]